MPKVKHVVLMRLKKDTPPATVRKLFADLDGLRRKVPGLLDFSGGAFSSSEGLGKGFTHGFVMTFADSASRDAYLPHPDHEAVKNALIAQLDGGLDAVVVFDWEE